jgi:hypothetical protein
MGNRRPRNPPHGKPPHAEGEHGRQTEARNIEQLESGPSEQSRADRVELDRSGAALGKRRLVEDRQQHDEAEKNSEHEQLSEETRRGRADGPSDNSGNLHGVLGSRGRRADHKERRSDGLPPKRRP